MENLKKKKSLNRNPEMGTTKIKLKEIFYLLLAIGFVSYFLIKFLN